MTRKTPQSPRAVYMIVLGTIAEERDYAHLIMEDVRIANRILDFIASLNQVEFRALKADRAALVDEGKGETK